jgi:hypothetical protein
MRLLSLLVHQLGTERHRKSEQRACWTVSERRRLAQACALPFRPGYALHIAYLSTVKLALSSMSGFTVMPR